MKKKQSETKTINEELKLLIYKPTKPNKKTRLSTYSKKKLMLNALQGHLGLVTYATKEVGINRETHYRWYNSDPKYKKEVDEIPDRLLDIAESRLFGLMSEKDRLAIIFYLKTKGKNRGYVEKKEIEHSGEMGVKACIDDLKNWSKNKDNPDKYG